MLALYKETQRDITTETRQRKAHRNTGKTNRQGMDQKVYVAKINMLWKM